MIKKIFLLMFLILNCGKVPNDADTALAMSLRLLFFDSVNDKLSLNPYTRTVPVGFAVASSTISKSISSESKSLSLPLWETPLTKTLPTDTEEFPQEFSKKKQKIRDVFENSKSVSDCFRAIPPKFVLMRTTPSCYGPKLGYNNHPDGAPPGGPFVCPGYTGCFPPGDLGIWTPQEASQEACSATQLNALVEYTGNKVDLAMGLFSAMACVAERTGKKLPEKKEALDLVQDMNAITAPRGLVFLNGTLERNETDLTDGRPIFFIKAEIARQIRKLDNTTTSIVFKIMLKHSPSNLNDYANYKGVFNVESKEPDYRAGLGSGFVKRGLSVVYEKTGSTLKYKMRNALFAEGSGPEIMFQKNLELNSKPSAVSVPGWNNDFNTMLSSVDEEGRGSLAYGWQAGAQDGYLRTFNVETRADNTGTAYFGFSDNNAEGTGDLKIDRMICNWAGPSANRTGLPKVQRQEIRYEVRYNLFVPVSNNTTYAPTNSCNWNKGTHPTAQFEGLASESITNNLIDIGNYQFTLPDPPTAP